MLKLLLLSAIVVNAGSGVIGDGVLRPSQLNERTHIQEGVTIGGSSGNTIIYTITPGKKLYITDIVFNGDNTSTSADGIIRIRDGFISQMSFQTRRAGTAANVAGVPLVGLAMTFPEPKQFITNVNLQVSAGVFSYSISFTGYEE